MVADSFNWRRSGRVLFESLQVLERVTLPGLGFYGIPSLCTPVRFESFKGIRVMALWSVMAGSP